MVQQHFKVWCVALDWHSEWDLWCNLCWWQRRAAGTRWCSCNWSTGQAGWRAFSIPPQLWIVLVFNSSTIRLCSPFSDCARHSPLIAGNPSTSGGEIETADCEIWSAAALRLLYSQWIYCCLILFPIYILLFYSQLYSQYCNVYIVVWFQASALEAMMPDDMIVFFQRAPMVHSFKGNDKSYKIKSHKYFFHC